MLYAGTLAQSVEPYSEDPRVMLVQVSSLLESLCCDLEQDTLSAA